MHEPDTTSRATGFEILTDRAAMAAVLRQQLADEFVVSRCDILHVRYRTYAKAKHRHKSFCAVCYRLEITDRAGNGLGEQIFYLRARRDGHSRTEFEQARTRPLYPPRFGRALEHLPELDATVWAFPNDPQLPHLPRVIDPNDVARFLPLAEPAVPLQVEIVHYYPEERCTSRYTLPGGTAERPEPFVLYGKTFKDNLGQVIYRRTQAMWRQSQDDPDAFLTARPLSYSPEIHTIWQENQPGIALGEVITGDNYCSVLEQVAGKLVRLQQNRLAGPGKITLDDHLAAIRDKSEKLICAFPQHAAVLQNLTASLTDARQQLPPPPQTLIHGEFHMKQLAVHEGRVILFDFDELALGDPLQDVANFIVDLHYGSPINGSTPRGFTPPFVRQMADAFGRAYARHAPWPVPAARLRWHLQVQFLTRAYRHYRQHETGMNHEVARMIMMARAQGETTADSLFNGSDRDYRLSITDEATTAGRRRAAVDSPEA